MTTEAGSPADVLRRAVTMIQEAGAVIRGQSRFYATPAVPEGSGPDFVNGALVIGANWSPAEAIAALHGIEAALGRRRTVRWGERPVDLDLLAFDDMVRPDVATLRHWMTLPLADQQQKAPGQLILPHPRLHERAFVLVPLAEVAPDWVHPVTRRSVVQMRDALPQGALDVIVALA